jgi:hypothetical protein
METIGDVLYDTLREGGNRTFQLFCGSWRRYSVVVTKAMTGEVEACTHG